MRDSIYVKTWAQERRQRRRERAVTRALEALAVAALVGSLLAMVFGLNVFGSLGSSF